MFIHLPAVKGPCQLIIAVFLVLPTLLATNQTTKAQNGAARPDRGLAPGHSYAVSDIENISLTNGNLNLSIPLASLPPMSGGKLSWTINAIYNSKNWDVKRRETIQGGPGAQARFMEELPQLAEQGVKSGWIVGGSYNLEYRESRADVDWLNDPIEPYLNWYKVIFTTPDGATHELKPVDYLPYDANKTHLFGLYKDNPSTVGGPVRYYSFDGSFLWAYVYNTGPISWRVYMKDGTQVIQYADGVQRIVDTNVGNSTLFTPNQNSIKIFTDSNGTTTTKHYQDERTGREIRLVTAFNGDMTVQYQTVGGGWVNINLVFGTTTVFGNIFEMTTYSGPDQTCQRAQIMQSSDMSVLREIRFPQTQLGQPQRKFTFSYDSDTTMSPGDTWYSDCTFNYPNPVATSSNGWGSLSQMVMPSGAQVNYTYSNITGGNIGPADNIPGIRVATKSLIHDGLPAETWTYLIGFNSGQVIAPDGATTEETSYDHLYGYGGSGVAGFGGFAGLGYRTNRSNKIITEKRWTRLKFTGGHDQGPNGIVQFNPVVDTEYTTLKENGQAIKMSAKKYQYDFNGNVTQTIEYDWFDPALVSRDAQGIPLSVPVSAMILRTTTTEYYNPADTAGSANVYAKRVMTTQPNPLIVSAPKQSISGASQTQYRYDNLAYGTAPVVGQLTHLSRWDNMAVTWRTVTNQYGDYGNVSSTTDTNNNTTTFIWDAATHANLTQITVDPLNGTGTQTVSSTFDFSTGSPLSVTDANGKTTETSYLNALLNTPDPFLRPGIVTGPAVTSVVNGINYANQRRRVRTTYYDATRQVLTESDLNQEDDKKLKNRMTFDQLGRAILSERNEDGTANYTISSQTIYVQPGLITLTSNPKRSAAALSDGWVRTTRDLLGRPVEVATFSGVGQPPTAGTNSNWTGTVATSYYAEQTTVTDQAGKMRRSLADGLGRLSQVIEDPNGLNYDTHYSYDQLNNLIRVAQGTQRRWFAYDSLSRLTRVRNPEQNTVAFSPGVSITVGLETNTDWSMAYYTYDPNSNLATKQDARGVTTTYQYDGLNRNTTVDYSDATPDVTRTYDWATLGKGRLYSTETTGSAGSRTTINNYDALGRPLSQGQQFRTGGGWSANYNVQHTYNLVGAVTGQTYPSGRTVAMTHDNAGRLSSFTGTLGDGTSRNYATGLSYAAAGQLTKETFGTNTPLYHRMYFNSRQQMYNIQLGTGAADDFNAASNWNRGELRLYYNSDYQVGNGGANNNGNVYRTEHVIPLNDNATTWADSVSYYGYDSLNRLISVDELPIASWVSPYEGWLPQSYAQKYTYDRWGNRTLDTNATWGIGINRKAFAASASNNQLTMTSGNNCPSSGSPNGLCYDKVGNLEFDNYTAANTQQYQYDAENRLKQATVGSTTNTYYYDGNGQRVRRVVWENSQQKEYWQVYGLGGELLAEYLANGAANNPQKEYGYRSGQLLMVYAATETGDKRWQWLVTDQLGTPRMIGDLSGSLTGMKRHDYLPFGEELYAGAGIRGANTGYADDNVRQQFASYERDNETGLDFAQARYFASIQGRFTSVDPLLVSGRPGNPQTWNRYTYALNRPLSVVDPTGLEGEDLDEQNEDPDDFNEDPQQLPAEPATPLPARVEVEQAVSKILLDAYPGYAYFPTSAQKAELTKLFQIAYVMEFHKQDTTTGPVPSAPKDPGRPDTITVKTTTTESTAQQLGGSVGGKVAVSPEISGSLNTSKTTTGTVAGESSTSYKSTAPYSPQAVTNARGQFINRFAHNQTRMYVTGPGGYRAMERLSNGTAVMIVNVVQNAAVAQAQKDYKTITR